MPVPWVSWCRAMMASIRLMPLAGPPRGTPGSAVRLTPVRGVQPGGKPPPSTSALMYGPGRAITYRPGLARPVEQPVHVAYAGEVVDAGLRRVVAPVEVERDRVEPGRLDLLEDVAPQVGARQPEVVELGAPQVQSARRRSARVLVVGDRVRGTRLCLRRGRCRGGTGAGQGHDSSVPRRAPGNFHFTSHDVSPFTTAARAVSMSPTSFVRPSRFRVAVVRASVRASLSAPPSFSRS